MEITLIYALKAFVLSSGLNLAGILIGLLVLKHHRRVGVALMVFSTVSLYLLALPVVARGLSAQIEIFPALSMTGGAQSAQAIVVLGAGRYPDAPEYGGDTVSSSALQRLRYAARLHGETKLPILVTGGSVFGGRPAEGRLMSESLARDFGVAVTWIESRSRNTAQNASLSKRILDEAGVWRILLVTHAAHMRRAVAAFESQEFEVVPAPTGFLSHSTSTSWLRWLPSATALGQSHNVMHELLGSAWYRVRYAG